MKETIKMALVGILLTLQFILLAAYLLLRQYHPQMVLLLCGLSMTALSVFIGFDTSDLQTGSGWVIFDLFGKVKEIMAARIVDVGLMIMLVGGYSAYMKTIGASNALIYISMQSLSVLKKYPYLASVLIIPIGQLLFICTPSATGLGLLLATSVYPVLVSLGVSRLSAVSVITACTVFDMGPVSSNTMRAATLIGKSNMDYFAENQLPFAIPLTVLLMLLYYFTNRYFDRREQPEVKEPKTEELQINVPLFYAILPLLPIILLVVCSPFLHLFPRFPIVPDTATAVLISLFIAFAFEWLRIRRTKTVFASLKTFWTSMGTMFTNVITLLVAAEVFSFGMINLGFIDGLCDLSQNMGFGAVGIGIILAFVVFIATIVMGSGTAAFHSFGSLAPDIAARFHIGADGIILPIQFSAGLGRAVSPISGVVVALSEIADVSPLRLAKRNAFPLTVVFVFLILLNYLV